MTFPVAAQDEIIKIETELVNLNVVVLDRQGRPVSGLTKEDFEVYEDGKLQEVTHFAADERPLRLVLLFDTSLSMEAVLPQVKREAGALVGRLRSKDEVSVVSFASEVRALSGWVQPEQARMIVARLAPEAHPQPVPATIGRAGYRVGDGNTNLYEALQYVFVNFKAGSGDRIAVIVFSDGVDTAAGRSINHIRRRADEVGQEVRRSAQESWALLYPVRYRTEQVIGDSPEPAWRPARAIRLGSRPADPGRELFSQIAEASGGDVFEWTTQRDLNVAVEGVLSDLRSQYGIAYKPPRSGHRTGFHRIKVRVKRSGMVARTREGYLIASSASR
jgi:Ca-activated chloride channel family protein